MEVYDLVGLISSNIMKTLVLYTYWLHKRREGGGRRGEIKYIITYHGKATLKTTIIHTFRRVLVMDVRVA